MTSVLVFNFGRMLSVDALRFEDEFCTSKKGGIGGGGWVHRELTCTWQLPWLVVEKPWLVLAWPFLSFLTQTGIDKAPLPL